ncbi:paired amphipathic helix [Armillaria luteobubalina]|uniref:Paired amphipathic helix n=1 Tax=Armillaria luteobubalina TaxID=153913 RepID=A0AA39Q682_9AGAR|nr:paired amphipathic helix [Armillaria luteobubalina]
MNTWENLCPHDVRDVINYVQAIKFQLQNQPGAYDLFLDTLKEYSNQLIDTPSFIYRVSHLLFGHPQLITGFSAFLPAGYRIDTTSDGPARSLITVTNSDGSVVVYEHPPPLPPDARAWSSAN